MNKNSTIFQQQKPKRMWAVKTEKSVVENKNEEKDVNTLPNDSKHWKVKTQLFKGNVEKVACEEEVSKSKAQNKAYWKNVKAFNKKSF